MHDELLQRIAYLERSNRRWKRRALAQLVIAALAVLLLCATALGIFQDAKHHQQAQDARQAENGVRQEVKP